MEISVQIGAISVGAMIVVFQRWADRFASLGKKGKVRCEGRCVCCETVCVCVCISSTLPNALYSSVLSQGRTVSIRQGRVLGGGNSNIFYFHPDPWGRFQF